MTTKKLVTFVAALACAGTLTACGDNSTVDEPVLSSATTSSAAPSTQRSVSETPSEESSVAGQSETAQGDVAAINPTMPAQEPAAPVEQPAAEAPAADVPAAGYQAPAQPETNAGASSSGGGTELNMWDRQRLYYRDNCLGQGEQSSACEGLADFYDKTGSYYDIG